MEKNTVILSLKDYDNLNEAYKKVNKPKNSTILIESTRVSRYECQTDDEATEKLAYDLKKAKNDLNEIEFVISNIKDMSMIRFMKWKRK